MSGSNVLPWPRCRLGDLLVEEDVRARADRTVVEVLSLTKRRGLVPQSERFENRVATENIDNYKLVRPGWIVYNPYVIWEGAIHALRRRTPGVVSPAYAVWRRIEDDGGYLDHILRTPEILRAYESLSAGAVNRRRSIAKNAFLDIEVPCPPLEDQRRIAAALNLVQTAIRQQASIAALVTEARSATLETLITGAAPDGDWRETELGSIPATWRVASLDDVAVAMDYGTSTKCSYDAGGSPVLRIPNVLSGNVDLSDLKYGALTAPQSKNLRLREGDLLFVRTNGAQENAGRCAVFRNELSECYFASYLIRVRVSTDDVLPSFVNEYARSSLGRSYLSGRAIRTADGKFNINAGTLKAVVLPVPPLDEQARIVSVLEAFDRRLDLCRQYSQSLEQLFESVRERLLAGDDRPRRADALETAAVAG